MIDAGIFDNDILVVDRAVKPRHNHVVVATVDGDLTVKYLDDIGQPPVTWPSHETGHDGVAPL